MMRRVNLALMELSNAEWLAAMRPQPARHKLAEYYSEWQRERTLQAPGSSASSFAVSLTGDDD